METVIFLCSKCRVNKVTDCDGQRDLDQRYDGRIICFDCRTAGLLDKATVKTETGKWRVFEDITHGWWGIEIDSDDDSDPILYPIKTTREKLDRIVDAHNSARGDAQYSTMRDGRA